MSVGSGRDDSPVLLPVELRVLSQLQGDDACGLLKHACGAVTSHMLSVHRSLLVDVHIWTMSLVPDISLIQCAPSFLCVTHQISTK